MTTEVEIIKRIKVEFSKEEEEMLMAALGVLRYLTRVMKDNNCDEVIAIDYDEEYSIPLEEIDDVDTTLENLMDIIEIR